MNMLSSDRCAGYSAAFALAATLVATPARSQESVWQEAASQAAGPLAAELAKAFLALNQDGDGTGDYMSFVTRLKAAGLGKPQEQPPANPGGGGEGERSASRFVASEFFEQLDADGDGTVSIDELPGEVAEHAREAEGAEDGKLTLEEFEPLVVEMRRREVDEGGGRGRRGGGAGGTAEVEFAASLDPDHDGKVTMADLRGAIEATLAKSLVGKASLDTYNDGTISKKEYAISMPYKFGEIDEYGMDGHARSHFKQEDLNEDGELSFEEVVRPVISHTTGRIHTMQLAARLAAANSDGDSTLSVEELHACFDGDVAGGETPWKVLGFGSGAVPVVSLYGTLARLSEDDATTLDRLLR